MSQWRCSECATALTPGKGGNVGYLVRKEQGRITINHKTGRPNFDALCKACGAIQNVPRASGLTG